MFINHVVLLCPRVTFYDKANFRLLSWEKLNTWILGFHKILEYIEIGSSKAKQIKASLLEYTYWEFVVFKMELKPSWGKS